MYMSLFTTSNDRKKCQRKINQMFRRVNKVIEDDSLWRGRFIARQNSTSWIPYEGTGDYCLFVQYYFIDKKTGQRSHLKWENAQWLSWSSKLFWDMNTFIVEECRAWDKDNDDPRKDKTDYRKVGI